MIWCLRVLAVVALLGIGVGCGSTQEREPLVSSMNLPPKPETLISPVASIGVAGGTPSTIGGSGRWKPAMSPGNPPRDVLIANQRAMQAMRSPIAE